MMRGDQMFGLNNYNNIKKTMKVGDQISNRNK